jgi:hypothetical protein
LQGDSHLLEDHNAFECRRGFRASDDRLVSPTAVVLTAVVFLTHRTPGYPGYLDSDNPAAGFVLSVSVQNAGPRTEAYTGT